MDLEKDACENEGDLAKGITWTTERRKLRDLQPWPRNPRQIKTDQAKRLVQSFAEFGQVETIAIGPNNEVYNGHQRVNVLMDKHGPEYEVEVRVSSRALTEKEREKLTVYLHKGAAGDWDWDALSEWDAPDLLDWGFDANELEVHGFEFEEENPKEDPGPQVDRAEELQEKWQVSAGDVWRLGKHFLTCGDSTNREDVSRVMQGVTARLVPTSPPYADQRDYEIGDFDWQGLMCGVFGTIVEFCSNPSDILVNLGLIHKDGRVNPYWNDWLEFCASVGWPLYGWYVWDKGSGFPGEWNGRLAPAHEFVFHFSKGHVSANKWIETSGESAKRGASGKRFRQKDGSMKEVYSKDKIGQPYKIPDSVIRVTREMARGIHTQVHPAVFSVEFAEFLIRTWSNPGDVVLEPFSGSGTTIIACENTDRNCRAIELEPKYVAVALQRWADLTGQTPERVE